MKNMKRAIRRHHYERLKAKRYNDLKQWNWFYKDENHITECSRRMATTPKNCSCWMCGNPRKYLNEITLQEERNLISFEEEMESWRELD